jgi:hypothetical protein
MNLFLSDLLTFSFFCTDGLAGNVKTTESTTNGIDKQALLKQVALVDVLDGWGDGILTIGTFGLDPLKPFNQQKEYLILQSEEEDEEAEVEQDSVDGGDGSNDNVEHEELDPLMFTTYGHNFEDFESNPDHHDNVPRPDVIMTVDGVSLTPFMGSAEPSVQLDEEGERKKKKGERITLADLFLADADVKGKLDPDKSLPDSGKTPVLRTKNGLSFAKKFIPRVKEDSRPIKNLQRVSNIVFFSPSL